MPVFCNADIATNLIVPASPCIHADPRPPQAPSTSCHRHDVVFFLPFPHQAAKHHHELLHLCRLSEPALRLLQPKLPSWDAYVTPLVSRDDNNATMDAPSPGVRPSSPLAPRQWWPLSHRLGLILLYLPSNSHQPQAHLCLTDLAPLNVHSASLTPKH
jgi:hypothetical protein